MTTPRVREAVRALVLDEDTSVLLVNFTWPGLDLADAFWACPGGGVAAGTGSGTPGTSSGSGTSHRRLASTLPRRPSTACAVSPAEIADAAAVFGPRDLSTHLDRAEAVPDDPYELSAM